MDAENHRRHKIAFSRPPKIILYKFSANVRCCLFITSPIPRVSPSPTSPSPTSPSPTSPISTSPIPTSPIPTSPSPTSPSPTSQSYVPVPLLVTAVDFAPILPWFAPHLTFLHSNLVLYSMESLFTRAHLHLFCLIPLAVRISNAIS